jgi:hypothetical protein
MAVPALPLLAPVLAVARTAVIAPALPAVVLAVSRAAVLALPLLAPVVALPRGLFRSPARLAAKPKVLLAAASTAGCVCVLAVASFVRKAFSLLRLPGGWPRARGWLPKRVHEEFYPRLALPPLRGAPAFGTSAARQLRAGRLLFL